MPPDSTKHELAADIEATAAVTAATAAPSAQLWVSSTSLAAGTQSTKAALALGDADDDDIDKIIDAIGTQGGEIDHELAGKVADRLGLAAPGYVPGLDWTSEEEKRVVRILDTRLMPWVLLSTFVLNMDRTNISNAISDHLPASLGFTTTVVNNATSIYAVVFSIFTFAGAGLAKRFSPHRVIPGLMLAWGAVTLAHAGISDATGYYLVRVFIAVTEGGVIPATLIYLGAFYKSTELATRLAWFWGVQSVASAVSGLMASGILQMAGIAGILGWKWLFIIDGILTFLAAGLLFYVLPRRATETVIFDARQAQVAATRVIRDDPVKLYYERHIRWSDVKAAFFDLRLWGHLVITIVGLTPLTALATYLPTIISSFGFNVYVSNALTAPGYILGFITMTTMTWHSDRKRERGLHGIFSATWLLLGFIILRSIPDDTNKYALWIVLLFTSAWPMTHPLNISWLTEHMAPLGKRSVASGAVIAAANIYAIWAGQIYQPGDAPRYHVGNLINIAFAFASVLIWIGFRYYLSTINSHRQKVWDALSEKDRNNYLATTKDVGNDRLDFRFTL
ncbi:hypothetical protein HK405_011455 [Cladochytrium tenue]|nr:hypothetical protein HK405_011455 [Cladochytrium tenue]